MKQNNKEQLLLIGLETQTSNADELSGRGKIQGLLQKFYGEYLGQIKSRTDSAVLALYTDYESDEQGKYTYFLGVAAANAENIPSGLSVRTIPAAKYEVLTSRQGKLSEIVLEVWQKVWQDSELKKRRAYLADFEVYDERCQDKNNAQVDVYISVKD